jgi:hypothetical protein
VDISARRIELFQHRAQRGAPAGAEWTNDQHESVGRVDRVPDRLEIDWLVPDLVKRAGRINVQDSAAAMNTRSAMRRQARWAC